MSCNFISMAYMDVPGFSLSIMCFISISYTPIYEAPAVITLVRNVSRRTHQVLMHLGLSPQIPM